MLIHIVIALTAVNLLFSSAALGARLNDASTASYPVGLTGSVVCSLLVIGVALFLPS